MPYEYDNGGVMYVLIVFLTFSLFEWGFNISCGLSGLSGLHLRHC